MRHIVESFRDTRSIADLVNESRVDEGLRDVLKRIKDKFKQAWQYLKGIVTKIGTYFLAVDDDGNVLPAITPLTAGSAMKEGLISKTSNFVKLSREGERITGYKSKFEDAVKLYGSGNSIKYWDRMLTECEQLYGEQMINEVKMHTEDPEAKWSIIEDDTELMQEILLRIKNPKMAKLLIWGAPGIGKTAILMDVINIVKKETGNDDFQLIVKTLSNETPDNFTLPKYVEINGQELATDVPKTWLPVYKPTGDKQQDALLDEKCGKGMLFIDELSRATPQVLNVILPLVNEGIFNGYKLGSGWTVICASNRAEDEMSGQSTIGNALANRFSQVYYEPTVKTWRKWADQQNFISPLLLQWLSMPDSENMSGAKFFYMDPNEDMDSVSPTTLMCTPRSWTNAMRQLAVYSHTGTLEGFTIFEIPRRIIGRVLNSYVPSSAVDSFLAFLEVIQRIGDFDAAVYSVWQQGGKGFNIAKKDLALVALPLAQLICTAHSDSLPTEEEFDNLCTWLISQKNDQLASYVLDVFKHVFGVGLAEGVHNLMFVLKKLIKKDPKISGRYDASMKPFYTKWGVDENTMPDYSASLTKLGKTYAEVFAASKVDGKDGLG